MDSENIINEMVIHNLYKEIQDLKQAIKAMMESEPNMLRAFAIVAMKHKLAKLQEEHLHLN